MSELFLNVVGMSVSAGVILLAVLLLRLPLKKAPKWITVLLWSIAAFRLVCPVTVESAVGLIPSFAGTLQVGDALDAGIISNAGDISDDGNSGIDNGVNNVIIDSELDFDNNNSGYEAISNEKYIGADDVIKFLANGIFSVVWLAGIAVLFVYTAVGYIRIKNRTATAVLLRDNIFQSENVASPFVFGIIKPRIYLPFNMSEGDMENVIAHEEAHIKRKDYIVKPLGFLLLAVHWFNPVIWLGYEVFCKDIELACDEKVVKDYTAKQRADYSQTLLFCSVNRKMPAACPLTFGEVGVKTRVKSVLNYKKPGFWVSIAAIIVIVAAAVCFLTSPKTSANEGDYSVAAVYEVTPSEELEQKRENGEYIIYTEYSALNNGMWSVGDYTYRYRLEITGKPNSAAKMVSYLVLSNTKDITFEQALKASGLSSDSNDYFSPDYAVIVGYK